MFNKYYSFPVNRLLLLLIWCIYSINTNAQDKTPTKYQQMAYKWNEDQFVIIKRKASFDTGCDTAKMKLTILETRYDANGGEHMYGGLKLSKKQKEIDLITATSVGVNGCGQKSVYVLMPTGGWMLNSNSNEKK